MPALFLSLKMELKQAIELIYNDCIVQHRVTVWADLGCGTGLFTQALAQLLQPGSAIHAVDSDKGALSQLGSLPGNVTLDKIQANFERDDLSFNELDGILMANSIHYIEDKIRFIRKAEKWLRPSGCFLLVEYDTELANPWVPYPLPFNTLKQLFIQLGYKEVKKLQERPSIYNRASIYSALVR